MGIITEAVIGAIIAGRSLPHCFFISHFTISPAPSSNRPESSSDFNNMILISSISSFELNKVCPFPALTTPFPPIFLSKLFIV